MNRRWKTSQVHQGVSVSYRSFQLDPNSPKETDMSLDEALAKKYQMSVEKAKEMNDSISEQAKDVGLEFNLDKHVQGKYRKMLIGLA